MRRHELDIASLVGGLVFAGIAVAYLIGAATSVRIDAGWVLPIGLVGLGVAGLGGTLRAGLRGNERPAADDDEAEAEHAEPSQPQV